MRAGQYLRRLNNAWCFRYRFAPRLVAFGLSGELIRSLFTSRLGVFLELMKIVDMRIDVDRPDKED
jgi:hypothetical protein